MNRLFLLLVILAMAVGVFYALNMFNQTADTINEASLVRAQVVVAEARATAIILEGQASYVLADADHLRAEGEFSQSPAGGVQIYKEGASDAGRQLLMIVVVLAILLVVGFTMLTR